MDWTGLPTMQAIREQRLLTTPQLAELEAWFKASQRADKALPMSSSLMWALRWIGELTAPPPPPNVTRH